MTAGKSWRSITEAECDEPLSVRKFGDRRLFHRGLGEEGIPADPNDGEYGPNPELDVPGLGYVADHDAEERRFRPQD